MHDTKAAQAVGGWLIGVMVEVEGERAPLRHFYAIGVEDRARAEWMAVDRAMTAGHVATSPVGGLEPVQAVNALTLGRMRLLGLSPGEVQPLGLKTPRRWMA